MPWAVTTPMPTVVFPDTDLGRRDWEKWEKSEVTRAWFCNHYRAAYGARYCINRERNQHQRFNACERCVAGFVYDPCYSDAKTTTVDLVSE